MAPKTKQEPPDLDVNDLPTPALDSQDLRMSYRIARGEQGVLTFEPYKSLLLPHWRFRNIPIAQTSSATLWRAFQHYVEAGDLVGADMARKFIQMGMTRAKRYADGASLPAARARHRRYSRAESDRVFYLIDAEWQRVRRSPGRRTDATDLSCCARPSMVCAAIVAEPGTPERWTSTTAAPHTMPRPRLHVTPPTPDYLDATFYDAPDSSSTIPLIPQTTRIGPGTRIDESEINLRTPPSLNPWHPSSTLARRWHISPEEQPSRSVQQSSKPTSTPAP
ncbi:hypothetical protein LTR33_016938 [Friedmanniomyces endolithicus]|nr:hypothetical protein LTR33_016938 [Friedmanniomyces endolithicus]